jgi:hypothetical protein
VTCYRFQQLCLGGMKALFSLMQQLLKLYTHCFCNHGTNFLRRVAMLKGPQHTLWLMNFKRILRLLVNTTHARRHASLYCKFGRVISRKLARNNFFAEFTFCDELEGTSKHKDFHNNLNSPSYKYRYTFSGETVEFACKSLAEKDNINTRKFLPSRLWFF